MSWHLWQRICGWAALVSAVLWAVKFTVVSLGARGDFPHALVPVAGPLVGFIVPTVGSLLGLIVPFALAAPYLSGRRLRFAIPVAAAVGVAAVVAVAVLQSAVQAQLSASPSELLQTEGSVLVSSLVSMVAACWLLRPRVDTRTVAAVLAAGGVLWLAKGIAVAAGAPVGGWTLASYQAGLWLLAAATLVAVVDGVLRRRFALPALLVAAYLGTGLLGGVPVLSGELGLLVFAVLGIAAGLVVWTRASRQRTAGGDA